MKEKVLQIKKEKEKFVLATLITANDDEQAVLRSFLELENLIDTAGGEVALKVIQRRSEPDPKTFIGRGKAEEIKRAAETTGADALAVDTRLSPSQQRNLEEITGLKVLDRPAIILDIFATHAKSLEGKLQVELAQLTYLQSRLIGLGAQLSRLGGGIGTRGPGETKLEVDRRRIKKRIQTLKQRLKKIEAHRTRLRSARKKSAFQVSLVGYTNAGKSTLLNALTRAGVYADDKLFATLDPTVRRLDIKKIMAELAEKENLSSENFIRLMSYDVVLTDTVGFIENLPHELIAAFQATLEETQEADLLLHVVNTPHPDALLQIKVVEETLKNLGAEKIPSVLVFNKIDICDKNLLNRLKAEYPDAIFISALKKEGIDELSRKIAEYILKIFKKQIFEAEHAKAFE